MSSVVKAFCALVFGQDTRLGESRVPLPGKRDAAGPYRLDGTLAKTDPSQERMGEPCKRVIFYAFLAERESTFRPP